MSGYIKSECLYIIQTLRHIIIMRRNYFGTSFK